MTSLPSTDVLSGAETQGELQQALDDLRNFVAELPGGAAEAELTISGGSVTPTGFAHNIDTEGDAASDDLANILTTNHPEGRELLIRPASDNRDVVAKHAAGGAGQISLAGGADHTLSGTGNWLRLMRVGTGWVELARGSQGYGVSMAAPAGAVAGFAMSSPPTGWVKCNGAAVSRTTYADLFAAIGETWGAGDGSTTFNLPDFRGEFVRGFDDSRGVDSGRVFGAWQTGTHVTGDNGASPAVHGIADTSAVNADAPDGTARDYNYTSPATGTTSASDASVWGMTRPRNNTLLFCIKY